MAGFFVTLEGTEGSGKSTIARRLADAFRAQGRAVTETREPGGTALGERIRALLLEDDADPMTIETEALLFAASRAQLVSDVIRPALGRGDVVIVDRYADSSLAYQWGARGLPYEAIKTLQVFATNGLEPDLKLLLDLPVPQGLQRRFAGEDQTNRMDREVIAFHERVRAAYHSLAAADPNRWRIIDASRPEANVWSEVWDAATELDPGRAGLQREEGGSRQGRIS